MTLRKLHRFMDGPATGHGEAQRATRAAGQARDGVAARTAEALRSLQRRIGNRAVARLLGVEANAAAEPDAGAEPNARLERESPPAGEPSARAAAGAAADAAPTRGTDAIAARKPRSKPGNGGVARKPRSAPWDAVARRAGVRPGTGTVQRTIQLDGVDADLADLLEQANDMQERVILANWGWSQLVHDFVSSDTDTAEEKLDAAVASAKSQAAVVPALCKAQNLAFMTKAGGREPTLYFISGATSGRIRQQHGSGPAVISQTDKTDFFFESKDMMRAFQKAARAARSARTAFAPNLAIYHATTTPTSGYFHFEVTFSGAVPTKLHPSGGQVDVNLNGYDDTKIEVIYNRAIGLST